MSPWVTRGNAYAVEMPRYAPHTMPPHLTTYRQPTNQHPKKNFKKSQKEKPPLETFQFPTKAFQKLTLFL
jgi:hypothetical protein